MTHANHQRNKFSEDSQHRATPSNQAALRGALLAFARPQSELQHPIYAPPQNAKATTAASLAFKDRPEVKRPSNGLSQSSQRQPSPSRSYAGEHLSEQHALSVYGVPSQPRAKSPLSGAASLAAYRLSPQSTGRRASSAQSGHRQWDSSEQEEVQEQAVVPGTVSDVKLWLENLNGPRARPRHIVRKPFARGMTLRPHLVGPSGTAVSAQNTGSSLGISTNFDPRHDSGPEVKSPKPMRGSSAAFSFETTMLQAHRPSHSTEMSHDGSDFDMYDTNYEQEILRQPEGHSEPFDEYDSEESGSDHLDMDDDTLRDALTTAESESNFDNTQEPFNYQNLGTGPIQITQSRSSLQTTLRPSMGSRPKSFSSETMNPSSKPIATGKRVPPLLTSGWQSPSSSSAGNASSAMIASTIAASRAPSPLKSPLSAPPLTRRHTGQEPHPHRSTLKFGRRGRSPSPPRGMMQTLRKVRSSSSDDDGRRPHKDKHRFHIRKHPNKHHEGDRKRWRNEITPRELKRYEGVWAANRGLLLVSNSQILEQAMTADAIKSQVSNVVVRDLWSRSRLPKNVLEEVWDLVDRERVGSLNKDQFVVGMWLVDQRLKGRKLPVKVSHSVWASARGMYGLKMPKLKDMPG